jgi:ribosomal-protein-alanine N-acetyltransferase
MLTAITVTSYQRRHLQAARDLLFHSNWVHTHLDWHETDRWLEVQDVPMRLAWQRGHLVGLLAVSTPLNGSCWIRMAAVSGHVDRQAILCVLWADLLIELREHGIQNVSALIIRDWLADYLPDLGFHYVEDIITLARYGSDLPAVYPNRLKIRVAGAGDLDTLAVIDHAAFVPPWQLAVDELRQAHRIAASCTVAVLDDVPVGYQLSTLYFDGAHLARLAVVPDKQGIGIGAALLTDLLERFFRRGVFSMTLNTQASNHRSQGLYTRFGFKPNGYDLPFWSVNF